MALTRIRFTEGSSGIIEGDIVDQDGVPVAAADLTTATLRLWDMDSYPASASSPMDGIINDRDGQDILNANDVTIGLSSTSPQTDGHFTWHVQPEDTIIVNPRRQMERHRATFLFEWSSGAFATEIEIEVQRQRGV